MRKFLTCIVISLLATYTFCQTRSFGSDPVKTQFAEHNGILLPKLTQAQMHFVLPDSVRMLLADARKRRGFFDKEVDMVRIAGKPSPFENFREYNFDGDRVYEVVEYDTIAANWRDRSGKPVYFQYLVQIQYHENNAIKSYISFLKVRQSEGGNYFQMGTRYYFDDTGKLRYSLDLDRLYTSPLKEIYKLLYAQKGDFAMRTCIRFIASTTAKRLCGISITKKARARS